MEQLNKISIIISLLIFLVFYDSGAQTKSNGLDSLIGRNIDLQECINVHDTILTVDYWDCAIEDNDTVSLNLNGVWILQKVRLTNAKKSLKIKVKPGENFLILYAHNLGDIPNNTAAASIHEQYAKQDIGLTSSLQKCGTARIACYIGDPSILMATLSPCVKKELSTAAADDAKHEIEVREAQIAQANNAKNSNNNNQTSAGKQTRRNTQRNYPRQGPVINTGPIIIPSGKSKTPTSSPAPTPVPAAPAPKPKSRPT